MARNLIDDVPVGWSTLGTDLLDKAPEPLVQALVGGESFPGRQMDDLITPDGSPPVRMTVRDGATDGLDWGYVLHDHGIEVISLNEELRGPVVGWMTDPMAHFSDHPALWPPADPAPARLPRTAPKLVTTKIAKAPAAASPPRATTLR
ncbi:hypothetical protein [Streptomyces erythrochromogenes]|uniref:hypothetical protein n=1 Tax=Streptomyces erythrochromogenes TaxID=285574 RepID=UPI003863CBD0|nr:hypothetical protein OG364_06205 [Streptomyces erythrochromogenes]